MDPCQFVTIAAMNDCNDVVESQLETETDAKIVPKVSTAAGTGSGSVTGNSQGGMLISCTVLNNGITISIPLL